SRSSGARSCLRVRAMRATFHRRHDGRRLGGGERLPHASPSPTLQTVQQGVNAVTAACAGDTVNVAGGPPYVQQITIGTSLNLIGAGAATTIISAPSPLTGNPGG